MKIVTTAFLVLFSTASTAVLAGDDVTPVAPAQSQTYDDLPIIATVTGMSEPSPVKAAHHLRAGAVLHASDLRVDDGNRNSLEPYLGMELKRAVYEGKVITMNDIGSPTLIERNAIVTLQFERGPLLITTEGRALDAGAEGETVRIMNLSSKIILTAEVVGPNKVTTR